MGMLRRTQTLVLLAVLAGSVPALPVATEAAARPFDRAAAAKALDRDYDECLLDDKPVSVVVRFDTNGSIGEIVVPAPLAATPAETCVEERGGCRHPARLHQVGGVVPAPLEALHGGSARANHCDVESAEDCSRGVA